MSTIQITNMTDRERKAMKVLKFHTKDHPHVPDPHFFRRNLAKKKINELLTAVADRDIASGHIPHTPEERPWFRGGTVR